MIFLQVLNGQGDSASAAGGHEELGSAQTSERRGSGNK